MRILYINYVDDKKLLSGSSVRPAKILKAFSESGHEVIVLSGNQFNSDRVRKVKNMLKELKHVRLDLCYIESPTYPIVQHSDRTLIKRIHQIGIPMAYFYRDFYRKFPEQFPRKTGIVGHLKDYGLIYVGEVIGHYDSPLLLDSCQLLHRQDNSFRLILVCREDEWAQVEHPCKNAEWLEVHHASGKELESLYRRASVAFVMPKKEIPYNEFAVSVKVFEYISYGLPVVAINSKALSDIVTSEQIGLVVGPDVDEVCSAVNEILSSDSTYQQYLNAVKKSLWERNLWKHRVNTIISDLTSKKQK